jgi:hypothetical protein
VDFWRVHALYLSADKSYLCSSVSVVSYYPKLHTIGVIMYCILVQLPSRLITECAVSVAHSCVMYSAWKPKDNYDMSASVFVVQFNGFMSLTS